MKIAKIEFYRIAYIEPQPRPIWPRPTEIIVTICQCKLYYFEIYK